MILRKRHTRREIYAAVDDGNAWKSWDIADEARNVEELFARQETQECLRQAVSRLTPALRDVVEIHQSGDRSVKEVADLAGISVAATKSRLLRARTILRGSLCGAATKPCHLPFRQAAWKSKTPTQVLVARNLCETLSTGYRLQRPVPSCCKEDAGLHSTSEQSQWRTR